MTMFKSEVQLSLKNCGVLSPCVRDTADQAQAKLLSKGKVNNLKVLSAGFNVCALDAFIIGTIECFCYSV